MVANKFAITKYDHTIREKYPIESPLHKSIVVTGFWFDTINYSSNYSIRRDYVTNNTGEKILKCTKVEVTFTPNQRNIILAWFSLYKTIYNIAIEIANREKVYNFIKLRALIKPYYKKYEGKIKDFGIPVHTLDNAIKDVCKAYKTAKTNIKNGNIKYFRLRPKRKCVNKETIVIEASAFSKKINSFAVKTLGEIKTSESIIGNNKDTRLTYNKAKNKFYLFLVYEDNTKKHNSKFECSLDPGLRTFQTMYDKKNFMLIGDAPIKQIKPIFDKLDKVAKYKNKPWYKKYTLRLREKIKNKVDDMHWQVANFLVKKYNEITIGKLSTKIVTGNLSALTKRTYYALAHYTFRERLQQKCKEYSVKYNEQEEMYTTKKCGGCGLLNNVGSSKMYNCNDCGFEIHRDHNGARNIMIKKDLKL
jgi:IS605 OrfB family transposase